MATLETARPDVPGDPATDTATGTGADLAPYTPRRAWWALMVLGGLLGVVSGVMQTVDRTAWAAGEKAGNGLCEINAVLSCSSVYGHWQSSALGIPNAMIGMPVFALIASAGLAGLLGSRLSRAYLGTIAGLTLGMTGFLLWYMAQSAFALGTLCLYCTACMAAIIVAGTGVARAVDGGLVLGAGRAGRELRTATRGGSDVLAWSGLLLLVAAMLYVGLAL